MIERCAAEGVNPGYPLGRDYPEYADGLLVAITEQRDKADIDRLAARRRRRRARGGARMRASPRPPQQRDRARDDLRAAPQPGRRAFVAPALDVPERDGLLPDRFRRTEPPKLPEIAEPEIVRHYNRLSKRNFDLDTGFYPLGSCTMKHNPKLHERVAALPGQRPPAPAPAPAPRAGRAAADVGAAERARRRSPACRTSRSSRAPGSHGELAGVLLTRAYHADRGEPRTKVLTPDTAHGTNPATVTMARLRGGQGRHERPAAASTSTTSRRRPATTSRA